MMSYQWFSNFFKISTLRFPKIFSINYGPLFFKISSQNQVQKKKRHYVRRNVQFYMQNQVKSKKDERLSHPQMSNQAQFKGMIYQKSVTSL